MASNLRRETLGVDGTERIIRKSWLSLDGLGTRKALIATIRRRCDTTSGGKLFQKQPDFYF